MKRKTPIVFAFLVLFVAPLAGSLYVGLPAGFTAFPPLVTSLPRHAPFSWGWFVSIATLALLSASLLVHPHGFGFRSGRDPNPAKPAGYFPAWGYTGLLLMLSFWVLAWNRFSWMGWLQDHTFFPIWFGYILLVDGLVYRLKGQSILSAKPKAFALLFPASAIAWWYFEFLNRFVKNWWYEGAESFSTLHYVVFATLSFSTVLPAIFETADWLSCHRWFQKRYRSGPKWTPWSPARQLAIFALAAAGLLLIPIRTDELFFLTWIAPLALAAAALGIAGIRTPFHDPVEGDYTRLFTLAMAALVCGFFWELWNFNSMPKWNYAVPFVHRFQVFEMPLLGYAGYLPFGPICWCLWTMEKAMVGSRLRCDMEMPISWMATENKTG